MNASSSLKPSEPVRPASVSEAFHDFITGTGAERTRLDLTLNGQDLTSQFLIELQHLRFLPMSVGDIDVKPGERVPAFLVQDRTAYFGWVFWEKFTEKKQRKLWGSVVRNKKGDWAIQIPPTKPTVLYANSAEKYTMDIEHPV